MTVKELRWKLFDIENQNAKVLVSGLNVDHAEVLELKDNWGKPTVLIFAASVDLYPYEEEDAVECQHRDSGRGVCIDCDAFLPEVSQ